MTIILSISFLIQLVYWYRVYGNLLKSGPVTKEWNQKAVSIIICVKDGINDLRENIHYFLEQNHPQFKIIIANDHSLDGSAEFLKKIDSERRTLTVYEVKQNKHGKKQALSEAIVVSQTNWVLLSDVDCKPRSQDWVQSMANCANASNIKVVLGYSPITSDKSLVSKWSHFESWLTGLQYLSLAKIGWPYMGVGRNLMYDKRVLKPDTYEKYDYLASGDDDLTIMQIATAENTAVNLDPDSFVDSKPQSTFKDYYRQKTRHYSTASSYRLQHQVLLGIYSLSQIVFYAMLLLLLWQGNYTLAVGGFILRLLFLLPVVYRLSRLLQAQFSIWFFPIYDLAQCFYYWIFSFAVLFPQKKKW